MIRIGLISDRRYVVSDPDQHWECETYTISPTAQSFRVLFHSAFSSPARYLQELAVRLSANHSGKAEQRLVFNPLFQLDKQEIWLTLSAIRAATPYTGITVLADPSGKPVAYLFPGKVIGGNEAYLSLLSTVDAELDARLCSKLFNQETRNLPVAGFNLAKTSHNGFTYEENLPIYRWVAAHALKVLANHPGKAPNELPVAAIMPHHAGDVLFFALAWNSIRPTVNSLVVNASYRAIADDIAPSLNLIPLDIPPINRTPEFRQGNVMPEGEYFKAFSDLLPTSHLLLYMRPSRDYNVSRFHLIDHFAFALGRHVWRDTDLLGNRPLLHAQQFPKSHPDQPTRILLFFDGGWPLKVYPRHAQQRLIDIFHRDGFNVTVLAGKGEHYERCSTALFENYAQLKNLLKSQDIMVGMDSFPTHLAAHVLHLPTLCLFASTRPQNSDAPASPHYRFLEQGLPCRPCYGIARCPRYGNTECANFSPPCNVKDAVEVMLNGLNGYTPQEILPLPPEQPLPAPEMDLRPIGTLKFNQHRARFALNCLAVRLKPSFSFLRQLHREFMTSLRRDGWQQTYLRSTRYLRKLNKSRC
ncbi:hypothetical protein AT959_07280 [Dechloromonas denitrificans]|uniref:Heptosyltransferase n=1 Tax=Dechloromonas denitrificans TaxID=281362 RepID=A0A133XKM5_9RHOO|nr:glycosyltransferase family 9 protein [Dechloromonas denitrificans]KXB31456.1 hypothetical protein AT959_07280 [Dechloromonas denitrificans]